MSEGAINNVVHKESLVQVVHDEQRTEFMRVQHTSKTVMGQVETSIGKLDFFSGKNQDQKVLKNDKWLKADPSDVLTKFPISVMVLEVVSSESHVMQYHFF